MPRAPRNKTLSLTAEEVAYYAAKNLHLTEPVTQAQITNQIICGDTFMVSDYLPRHFVDLLVVDPPYNLYKNYHGHMFKQTSMAEYAAYTQCWIEKMLPLLRENASVYVCCDWRSSMVIGSILARYFLVQNRISWQREKGRGAKNNWKNGMEDIWFCTCGKDYYFCVDAVKIRRQVRAPYRENGLPKDWEQTAAGNFRNTYPSNFWDDISIPYWSMAENTDHPTQKPEKLLAKLILASSRPGDMVLDPFLGSGTTAVVAKKLGRCFCGVEQNPVYCSWAQKRLEMAEQEKTIQGFADGVFWERNTVPNQNRKKKSANKMEQKQ